MLRKHAIGPKLVTSPESNQWRWNHLRMRQKTNWVLHDQIDDAQVSRSMKTVTDLWSDQHELRATWYITTWSYRQARCTMWWACVGSAVLNNRSNLLLARCPPKELAQEENVQPAINTSQMHGPSWYSMGNVSWRSWTLSACVVFRNSMNEDHSCPP